MQPLQCVLQHLVANPHLSTHMATPDDNNHAAIPQIQKTNRIAHRNNHSLQNTEEEHIRDRNDRSRNRRTHEVHFIAGCSHFARKNPRFRAPASSPQRASLPHHFPSSPPLTTSLRHHFPSSPLPIVTTSLHHHLPSSPLPFVTTSLPHHFPSSPFPFFTTLCHSFLFFCYVL